MILSLKVLKSSTGRERHNYLAITEDGSIVDVVPKAEHYTMLNDGVEKELGLDKDLAELGDLIKPAIEATVQRRIFYMSRPWMLGDFIDCFTSRTDKRPLQNTLRIDIQLLGEVEHDPEFNEPREGPWPLDVDGAIIRWLAFALWRLPLDTELYLSFDKFWDHSSHLTRHIKDWQMLNCVKGCRFAPELKEDPNYNRKVRETLSAVMNVPSTADPARISKAQQVSVNGSASQVRNIQRRRRLSRRTRCIPSF